MPRKPKAELTPTRKVGFSAIAGALSIVLVWVLKTYGVSEIPPEVSSAMTTVISAIVGYFVVDA